MAIDYSIVGDVTTSGCIQLYHGTCEGTAINIKKHGVSKEMAMESGGTGEFWASIDYDTAAWFSQVTQKGSGPFVVLGFELFHLVLQDLLNTEPQPWAWVRDEVNYEFLPPSYQILNSEMTNITIKLVE